MARRVWILFAETNCGRYEESDGYVHSVYEDQQDAEAARKEARQAAREDGETLYCDDDGGAEHLEWTLDYHVESHEVRKPKEYSDGDEG
jgi:hypothetical protein